MIRTLVPAFAAAVLLAPAVPAAAQTTTTTAATATSTTASSSSSTKTSSPDEWAGGVCAAVDTWLDDVDGTVKGLTSADSLDAAADQAKSGIQAATETLTTTIEDLGRPSTGDGKKAKKQIDQLGDDLRDLSESIQALLSDPGSNPVQIAGTLAQVGTDVGKAVNEVQDTATSLKGLKPNGELRKAFKTEPSCTELKQRL